MARPRALVVLKKARETAGGFAPEVTSWISENLQLRTTVPDLVISDSGELAGGIIDTKDILEHVQVHKSELPGVIVGPDSTPTLSFTSGSEGRPKGVRGRHFSLLHYFPWMAERFGLSENDRLYGATYAFAATQAKTHVVRCYQESLTIQFKEIFSLHYFSVWLH